MTHPSRRQFLLSSLALGAGAVLAPAARAVEAAAPYAVAPELIGAAKREGKVVFYTSMDLVPAERLAKAFERKYPGIDVQVERSGAERLFQRINQEHDSGIANADVVDGSDTLHFIVYKRNGWLAQAVPDSVARRYAPEHKDPDGTFASDRATLMVMGYNTRLVKPADAPKSYADLLDPKWKGQLVKAHPGFSGVVMTGTHALVRTLGWGFYEKLSRQHVMQVQAAVDAPKKLARGEHAVMVEGNEYNMFLLREAGQPVEIVYAAEGTPFVPGQAAVMASAPHPKAARLFYAYLFSAEGQEILRDAGGLRSLHPDVGEKPGRTPLSAIKLIAPDPAALEGAVAEIRRKYAELFGV